ncbi:hypothetical protein [Bdellovibrio sp. BCCA]|uniref:hypothetical protein n=1 Tax=Bdellovibrio sp. BCCA TaxID=3136281 RepID=UPI0030F07348
MKGRKKLTAWDQGFICAALVQARLDGLGSQNAQELLKNGGYTREDVERSKALSSDEVEFIYEDTKRKKNGQS